MSNVHLALETVHLSALGTAAERGFAAPFKGRIREIRIAVDVAASEGGATLTATIDGVAVTGGTHATSTAAAGTTVKIVPTAANTFREGQYVSMASDGGGADAAGVYHITFVLEQS